MGLLTVAEVAEQLNVSRGTIYNLCATGELPHRRVGSGAVVEVLESEVR